MSVSDLSNFYKKKKIIRVFGFVVIVDYASYFVLFVESFIVNFPDISDSFRFTRTETSVRGNI